MSDYVLIREVGMREGFQSLGLNVLLADKLKLVDLLNSTGVKEIELTAFVRPDLVPAMADAAKLVANFSAKSNVKYKALYLNKKGFELAEQTNKLHNEGWLYTSASETFFKKNYNSTLKDWKENLKVWLETFKNYNKPLHGIMVSCAFGCGYEGNIEVKNLLVHLEEIFSLLKNLGIELKELSLADTVGHTVPKELKSVLKQVNKEFPVKNLSLHLHDTRGMGIANVTAGLEEGVRIFEASLGGLGGCPFAPGASGNVATEEVVYLCQKQGLNTGIQLDEYMKAIAFLKTVLPAEIIFSKLSTSLLKL